MNCLNPIQIVNNSHTVTHGSTFLHYVPCGKCAACKALMQSEYFFRSYYQYLETIQKGGYVYFDTLTYADNHLPHISDFEHIVKGRIIDHPCFNLDHYRKFFVRLRRKLTVLGYNPSHSLKYFLCSEYGTDESKTHRPHYHVLFYVTDPKLDSYTLSQCVADCWPYGRTDGIPYKSRTYVKEHTFAKETEYGRNICLYVAKYVTKSSKFEEALDNRINAVTQLLCSKIKDKRELKKHIQQLNRHIREFHRQSQGFGIYGLKYNDLDEMFATGLISMPTSDDVRRYLPIPMYFQRKLFYDLITNGKGKKQWIINDKGIEYRLAHLDENIDRAAQRFEDWFQNLPNDLTVNDVPTIKMEYMTDSPDLLNSAFSDTVTELLSGRSFHDFAEYVICYKGKVKTNNQLNREENGIYQTDPPKEFLKASLHALRDQKDVVCYNYATQTDRDTFKRSFLCKEEVPTQQDYFRAAVEQRVITTASFIDQYVINDRSDSRFHGFDRLYRLFLDTQYFKCVRKNLIFNHLEQLNNLYDKFKN